MQKAWKNLINWEQWNFFVLYMPLFPVWFWYCLRSRSFWFFSSSNPTITFGGFEGEGKKEMYDQLPKELYPSTIYISSTLSIIEAEGLIRQAGFQLPFTVKPDVGMKGLLFRKIKSWEQWRAYHEKINVMYLVQAFVDYLEEFSVFYYRHPNSSKGTISGFIRKDLLQVKGDGISTLQTLILSHPKACTRVEELRVRHAENWNRVVDKDAIFYLSYAGNHNRGAQFTNLSKEINDTLLNKFDQLSYATSFYYGRYDIKALSLESFKQGKDFSILEFNGCGAEPNHIYDCGMSLLNAYKVLLAHWAILFEISSHNHLHGYPYWSFLKGWKFLKMARVHFEQMEKLDVSGI